jgi:hypothetical protein
LKKSRVSLDKRNKIKILKLDLTDSGVSKTTHNKAHSFTKPSLAKVQERLECETLYDILNLSKLWLRIVLFKGIK